MLESEIAPGGGSGEDPYELDSDAEFVHVLEGMLDVEVAGTRYRLAAGDSLTFDAGAAHRWTNPSRRGRRGCCGFWLRVCAEKTRVRFDEPNSGHRVC